MKELTRVGRPFLRKVIAVYAVLAIAAVALPALLTRPRPIVGHQGEQARALPRSVTPRSGVP
jgi:hypothetical protein